MQEIKNEQDVYDAVGATPKEEPKEPQKGDSSGYNTAIETIKYKTEQIIVSILFVALFAFSGYALYTTIRRFLEFKDPFLPLYMLIPLVLIPLALWFYSTKIEHFSFYERKRRLFIASLLIPVFAVSTLYLQLESLFVDALLSFIPIENSMVMNERTIVVSSWVISGVLYFFPMYALASFVIRQSRDDIWVAWFNSISSAPFLKKKNKNAKFAYDLNVIKDMTTGKDFVITESDRRLHMLGLGSTGTGKTSAIATVAFESDIRRKALNSDIQKKIMHRLMKEGLIEPTIPFDDIDFNINNFRIKRTVPEKQVAKIEEEIARLKKSVRSAGLTVFCPNTEYCEELYALCKAKKIRANRIDPVKGPDGKWKEGFIGFNPLYVYHDPEEDDTAYFDKVFDVAKAAADVNQAVFDLQGTQDAYFSGLNRNIYVAAAIVCIIGMPIVHPGCYAKPDDVQDVLNDFTKVELYRNAVVNTYGIPNESGAIEKRLGKARVVKNLQFVIDRLDKDMLGPNQQKMTEQAVGLRNIVDETLMIPAVREVLCSERTLDFNRALADGEVTLINFNLSMGDAASTNFGLFFLLNFINAALRRPGTLDTRIPHFLVVDECARLFHPKLEITLALFRQYNIACTYFVQNLGQFDKNQTTKYLKGVFASNCAHQVFYGRAGVEEMKYIEDIAGQRMVQTESLSVRYSSLADDSTNKNLTTQYKEDYQNNIEATDARYRNFLECTVLSVKDSSALPPFIGKTNFLPKYKRGAMKRLQFDDWREYYTPPTSNAKKLEFTKTSETEIEESASRDSVPETTPKKEIGAVSAKTEIWISGGFEEPQELSSENKVEQQNESVPEANKENEKEVGEQKNPVNEGNGPRPDAPIIFDDFLKENENNV